MSDGAGAIGRSAMAGARERGAVSPKPRAPEDLGAPAPRDPRAALEKASHELEAVFLRQLFAAMREGQVESGLLSPAPGEDMLTSLMDDRLASVAAARMKRGLGAALYRQLSRRLPPAAGAEETP